MRITRSLLALALLAGCTAQSGGLNTDQTAQVIAASNALATSSCIVLKKAIKPDEATQVAEAIAAVGDVVNGPTVNVADLQNRLDNLIQGSAQAWTPAIASSVSLVVAFVPPDYKQALGVGIARNALNLCRSILSTNGGTASARTRRLA